MLHIAYYALLLVIITGIGTAFAKAGANKKFLIRYYTLMLIWSATVAALSLNNIYKTTAPPPRLVLLGVLPSFAIIIYFFSAKKFKLIIQQFPIQFAIYFQSFRILVELLIFGAVLKGLAPEIVSFNGRNIDIIAGLTAPLIGWLYSRGIIGKGLLLAWNILALMILANIVFIFMSLMINPHFWGYDTTPISMDFLTIPYVYIAAVFMPVAVFLHVMCIRKIRARSR